MAKQLEATWQAVATLEQMKGKEDAHESSTDSNTTTENPFATHKPVVGVSSKYHHNKKVTGTYQPVTDLRATGLDCPLR
jgi:hypothetical protein